MSNLLTEMYTILGWPQAAAPQPSSDTPREVVGTFAVFGPTSLDETIIESIAELSWDDVFDVALLAAVGPEDLSRMATAYHEGTSEFREIWNTLVEEDLLDKGSNRGVFVLLTKECPRTESMSRYIHWCLRTVQESSEKTKSAAVKKSTKFHALIPSGTEAQHAKGVAASEKYLTPQAVSSDGSKGGTVMPNSVFKGDKPTEDGMVKVVKAEKALTKVASAKGMQVDQAFPNLFVDLARERVRNS